VKKTSAILALAACACTFAAAETVEGVLEKSAPYSALFSASPESGDLIGKVDPRVKTIFHSV
jgi:hypothetical protein